MYNGALHQRIMFSGALDVLRVVTVIDLYRLGMDITETPRPEDHRIIFPNYWPYIEWGLN
jgi:hypothetical protein